MKKRADGRYQKKITVNGKSKFIYGKTQKEVTEKIINLKERELVGEKYKDVASSWWIEQIEEKVSAGKMSPQTKRRYEYPYNCAMSKFGNMKIKNISSDMIDKYIKSYVLLGKAKKTVKGHLSILNQIFNYAYVHDYIEKNPCDKISADGVAAKERELPGEDTGLRKGEALALTWDDIDYEKKSINVNKNLYYIHNKGEIKSPKTNAGIRQVILLPNIENILKSELIKNNSKYVFCNDDGEMLHGSNYNRLWKKYKTESGISGISAHSLRHAYCTILYDAGIDIKSAQSLMGHASEKMTRDIYTHISNYREQETRNKLIDFVTTKF